MFERAIVHMDLDSFFVSVECLKNDALRGKPLIIGGAGGRGVVASCSYEARRFGVHSAMPVKMALRLCPDALVLRGDMEDYSKHSAIVTDIIAERSPMFEKTSIDEFYMDLSGMDRYFGCYKWSNELRDFIIKETGLPISFGLSINKTVSKIGTGEAKPNGKIQIAPGNEKQFLAPLSTNKIPGVGKETYKRLSFMGVRTVRILSEIPVKLLEREFGIMGKSLWQKANGIDYAQIEPYTEQKSMSSERTLSEDTLDLEKIRRMIRDMTDKLAFELRKDQKLCSCVTVKIRYADFNTYTKQKKIAYTASDKELCKQALSLFESVYERRQLIRLIGVKFSGMVHGSPQIRLFEDTEEQVQLMQAMDRIRNRFGKDSIHWA
ncbi:MAG: DNA polymerase IV [Saprospiraceae bacterium]|nr:DNA polymerase IV [Saprospiraceae bacterium]